MRRVCVCVCVCVCSSVVCAHMHWQSSISKCFHTGCMCAQFWHIKHGCQVETSWILSLSGAERKQPWSLTARVLSLSNWFWKGFISFPHQSEEEEAMNPLLQWKKRKIIRVKTLLSQIDLSSRGLSGPDVSELDWGCDAVTRYETRADNLDGFEQTCRLSTIFFEAQKQH